MKIYSGEENLYEETYLYENGYGDIKPTGFINLYGDINHLKNISSLLESKFKIIDLEGCMNEYN